IAAEVEGLVAGFDRERSGPALAPDEVERRAGRVLPPQDRVSAHLLEVEVRGPERELGRVVAVDIGAVASGGGGVRGVEDLEPVVERPGPRLGQPPEAGVLAAAQERL